MKRTSVVLLSTMVLILCGSVPAIASEDKSAEKRTLDSELHELALQKVRAEDWVRRAKEIIDPVQKERAFELYAEARAQYNAYIDDIARKIQYGSKGDIEKDANDAYNAGEAFRFHVDKYAPPVKGVLLSLIPGVQDLLKRFGIIGDSARNFDYQKKKDLAEDVRKYRWDEWVK